MEDEDRFGAWEARAKSSFREGSLGCVMVEAAVVVGFPTNCAARSLYWACNVCSVFESVRDALAFESVRRFF